jgi:CBS domain-containing protein
MNADVTVREAMDREYLAASESDDLVETVALMLSEDVDTVVVQRGSEPVGLLTHRDILSIMVEGMDHEEATVEDAMTPSITTVEPEVPLPAAADMMSNRSTRRLVVTNDVDSEPLGLITEHDIVETRAYGMEAPAEPTVEAGTVETAAAESAIATEAETESQDNFEDQSICEVCGALSRDLVSFNGQLRCPDCRNI